MQLDCLQPAHSPDSDAQEGAEQPSSNNPVPTFLPDLYASGSAIEFTQLAIVPSVKHGVVPRSRHPPAERIRHATAIDDAASRCGQSFDISARRDGDLFNLLHLDWSS